MEEQAEKVLLMPLSINVPRETLDKVFTENPVLLETLATTLKGMEAEIASFLESIFTPNALLIEKNIPDYTYNTNYGLSTVILSVQAEVLADGMQACLESGDLSRMAEFVAAEITEARIRAEMEKMSNAIRWMAKETKKIGRKRKYRKKKKDS